MARCKILNNNVELNAADIRNLINQISGNQPLLDSIIYDNFNRMKLEDKITYIDARDYIMQTFNLSVAEFTETIERAGTKRHSMSGKPLGFESVGTLINSSESSFSNKLGRLWYNTAKVFTSMGAFFAYKATEEGRMAAEATKQKAADISAQGEMVEVNINRLNDFLERNKEFFSLEDLSAISGVLNNDFPNNQGRFDNLTIHMFVDSGKLTQQQVDTILNELGTIIDDFRTHIDIFSEKAKNMPGLLNSRLYQAFLDNKGKYTTTFYRVHKDSAYAENFKYVDGTNTVRNIQFQAVYERALHDLTAFMNIRLDSKKKSKKKAESKLKRINTLLSNPQQLSQAKIKELSDEADKLVKKIANATEEIDYLANRVLVNNGINPDMNNEIVNFLIDMHNSANDNQTQNIAQGLSRSRINKGILKQKKGIPQAVKDLMGQYKDIRDLYTMTVSKLSGLVVNAEYQQKIADLNNSLISKGLPPFFSILPDTENGLTEVWKIPDSYPVLINALGTSKVYVNKDMKESFDDLVESTDSSIFANLDVLNSIIKANLVVRGYRQIIRNLVAWWTKILPAFATARNKSEVLEFFIKSLKRRVKEELYRIKNISKRSKMYGDTKKTIINKRTLDEDYMRGILIEQRLKSSELVMSDINKSFDRIQGKDNTFLLNALNKLDKWLNSDLNFNDPLSGFASIIKAAGIILKDAFAVFGRLFAGGDDLMKETLFVMELQNAAYVHYGIRSYKEAMKKLSPDQIKHIEDVAGRIVRRTAPNYNEAWDAAKSFQKYAGGVVGPFITYQLEAIRTTKNMYTTSVQQIKNNEADLKVSQRMRSDGYRRMISYSLTLVLSTTFGGAVIYGALLGGKFLGNAIAGALGYGWGPDDDEEDKKFGVQGKASVLKYYGYPPSYMSGGALIFEADGLIVAVDPAILNVHGSCMNVLEGGIDVGVDVFTGSYDENTKKKLAKILSDFITPFVDAQPIYKSVYHYINNEDEFGNPISEDSDKRTVLSASGETLKNFLPSTVKTVMSSQEKKERVKKIEADIAVLNKMLEKGGKASTIESIVNRKKILHRNLEVAKEKVAMDDGVNQFLALGAVVIDPGSYIPANVWDKVDDVKKSNINLASKIGDSDFGVDVEEPIYEAKNEYKNDIEYLKKWYSAMKRMGYGESVARMLDYGVMRSLGKEQAKKQPLLSKSQLAYIKGETDKFPKANLSAAEWAKMHPVIGEPVN